jgi:hypothetical protein
MDIKTFFALNEGQINEMAATAPKDVALNTELFRQMKADYGVWRDGDVAAVGGDRYHYAWPIGQASKEDRQADVSKWLAAALKKGLHPDKPSDLPTDQNSFMILRDKKMSDLNWAFNPNTFSSIPAKKTWEAAAAAGFVSPEQFARFKQLSAMPKGAGIPKMSSTIGTRKAWYPGAEQPAAPAAPPAAAPTAPPPEEPVMAQAAASAPPAEASPEDEMAQLQALAAKLGIKIPTKKSGKK